MIIGYLRVSTEKQHPANQQERDFNARMVKKAEILRNRRLQAMIAKD